MPSENQNQQVLISIDDVKKDFEDFLNLENNNRIFFSGKFGIGKTFFLQNFFNEKDSRENNNEEGKEERESQDGKYKVVHLYPVNYQIRENSLDIVELIKYDILIEFFSSEKNIVEEILNEYSKGRNFRSFLKRNKKYLAKTAFDLAGEMFEFVKLTGKALSVVGEIYNTWKSFKRKEELILRSFLSEQDNKLKETDFISQFIWEINNRIRQQTKKEKNKQTILILDDLDRLDPDNIFRILNVFSAFFEKENENKFGFSKVIIVGDYENIKKIFHHKYGEDTDFQGYMDKFFSIRPYEYLNTKAILSKLDYFTSQVLELKKERGSFDEQLGFLIKYVFLEVLNKNLINLREMLKTTQYDIHRIVDRNDTAPHIIKLKESFLNLDNFIEIFLKIDESINLLIAIFGGKENLLEKLNQLREIKQKYAHLEDLSKDLETLNISKLNFFAILKFFSFFLAQLTEGRFFESNAVTFNILDYKEINLFYKLEANGNLKYEFKQIFLSEPFGFYNFSSFIKIRNINENDIYFLETGLFFILHRYIKTFF